MCRCVMLVFVSVLLGLSLRRCCISGVPSRHKQYMKIAFGLFRFRSK